MVSLGHNSVTLWNSLRIPRATMSIPISPESVTTERPSQFSIGPILGFGGLILLLAVPLFLRMPLTNDTVLFDLQTRMISEGSVPYRDVLEPNWPGVFWVHWAVRSVLGSSSEAMRLFDLCGVMALSWMLSKLALFAGATRHGVAWLSLALMAFYLSCSEWCHCQRDTWLLVPMTAAICLRMRRLNGEMTPWVYTLTALGEGFLWGAACWLKPYATLVAASVWIVTLPSFSTWRKAAADAGLVIVGGVIAGIGGLTWLMRTGAWPFWLETMRDWNPRYLAAGREHWVLPRFEAMFWRMQPWYWLHLLALPLALGSFRHTPHADGLRLNESRAVLAAIYLATLAHVIFLQHLFDYVHAPAVLLAIVVVGTWLAQPQRSRRWRFVIVAFGLIAAIQSPLLKPQRIRLWWACVTQSNGAGLQNKARLQDKLALLPNPHRVHLERVADFLRQKNPDCKAVNALNSDLVSLYSRLDLRPPTRFVYVWELLLYFPQQRNEIMTELANSRHRFVVSDLVSCGMSLVDAWEIGPDGPHTPPPKYQVGRRGKYPWSHPVVFRSGPYLVHEVTGSIGKPASP